jgi:PhnB protein
MAQVSIYLNFPGTTEEAFNFYKSVFGGEFSGQGIMRFRDVPPMEGHPPGPESVMDQVMHVELRILDGFQLMGSDAPAEFGFTVNSGNNFYINLMPETREQTRNLFYALAEGGKIESDLQDMFWGDYYGSCRDKYGVQWMFNCSQKEQ